MKIRSLFITFLIFYSFLSHAETVKSIQIDGLSSIDRGTVLNYLPVEINDDFNEQVSKEAIQSLKSTNLFENVSLTFSKGEIIIKVIENPTIKYFDFIGYKSDAVLSEKIVDKLKENFNLNIGKIFVRKKLDELLNQVVYLYENEGYYNASLKTSFQKDTSNRIGIEVLIEENKPALITSFDIVGNNFFKKEDLIDLFEIGLPDIFFVNYFTEKDRFNKKSFESGIELIKSKYLASGFLDFKIKNIKSNITKDNTGISLLIELDEGEQSFINKINWSGDIDGISTTYLNNKLNIKAGSVFNRKAIILGLNNVRDSFANLGFANASIDSLILDSGNKKNYYDLKLTVKKNNIMYVNRIDISGNTTTQDDVIRRELLILENQLFSKELLDESLKRVKRLGYFSDVNIQTIPLNNQKDKFNINVKVTETKTGEFTVGLSHSNSYGASFNTGIQQNNILGTGNIFNARFTNSSAVEEVSFYFKNPYITDEGNSLSYGLFSKSTNAANLSISDYVLDETGGSIGYGIPLTVISDISSELKVSDITVKCSDKFAGADYEMNQCLSSDSLDFSIGLDYIKSSLNDFYQPTDGSKTTISSTLSMPIGDFKYYQLSFKQNNYMPILVNSTFNTKFNAQLASGYGNSELPFFKRYFGGGSSSVRGFDFNSLGAKYPDQNAKGGEISILTSAAIIAPASKIGLDNDNIRVSAFIDAGSIFEKKSSFDIGDIRASSGLALSWLTPIGPIGFYAAKPLIKKTSDTTKTFSFELGTSF